MDMLKLDPSQLTVPGHQQLSRIEANPRPPVLVVGMHNSGTSILAEILHKSGVFLGANMPHYESFFFSVLINDRLILGEKLGWANLPLMPIDEVMQYLDTAGAFARRHWLADYLQYGYDGCSAWGIKDPRLCVLLPLYLELFPGARVVHIRRNPDDVAASLCRRKKYGVGKLDDFEHWKQLTQAYTGRVLEHASQASAYHELEYEAFCTESEPVTRDLFAFLGLDFSTETGKLLEKVSPSRIGSYDKYQKRGRGLSAATRRLIRKLR